MFWIDDWNGFCENFVFVCVGTSKVNGCYEVTCGFNQAQSVLIDSLRVLRAIGLKIIIILR